MSRKIGKILKFVENKSFTDNVIYFKDNGGDDVFPFHNITCDLDHNNMIIHLNIMNIVKLTVDADKNDLFVTSKITYINPTFTLLNEMIDSFENKNEFDDFINFENYLYNIYDLIKNYNSKYSVIHKIFGIIKEIFEDYYIDMIDDDNHCLFDFSKYKSLYGFVYIDLLVHIKQVIMPDKIYQLNFSDNLPKPGIEIYSMYEMKNLCKQLFIYDDFYKNIDIFKNIIIENCKHHHILTKKLKN